VRRTLELPAQTNFRVQPGLAHVFVPSADAIAVAGAVAASTGFQAFGLVFLAVAVGILNIGLPATRRLAPRLGDDLPGLLSREGLMVLIMLPVAVALSVSVADVTLAAVLTIVLVGLGRGMAYALLRWARVRGTLSERTLIAGAGPTSSALAEILLSRPEYGLAPIGFLDDLDHPDLTLPLLGQIDDLERVVGTMGVTRVVVAFGSDQEARLAEFLRVCGRLQVEVHLVPPSFDLYAITKAAYVDDVWSMPLLHLRRPTLSASQRLGKRAFDLVVGGILLVLTSPIMLAVAMAVWRSSPGPILFHQRRVGLNGREFVMLKFRTMHVNHESDTQWSVAHDARVTRVGRFLRRSSVDELPQIFNVLRGDMSLVGPRPERPQFVNTFAATIPGYADRHRVPGGMTGWAQVHGLRGDTSIADRALFDSTYIENWSMWGDVVILARTARQVLRGESA
jgi:exopolysaccharide biosynthesis polyprenyl glycosylphosphotransferase